MLSLHGARWQLRPDGPVDDKYYCQSHSYTKFGHLYLHRQFMQRKKVKLDPRQINSCSILDMLEMTCSFRVLITVIKKINVIFWPFNFYLIW